MEGSTVGGGNLRRYDVRREVWQINTRRGRRQDKTKGKTSAENHGEIGETPRDILYGGLSEGIGMKTY